MGPEAIRIGRGFVGIGASALALSSASPALAQGYNAALVNGAMPLTIALGAGAFAIIAGVLFRRMLKDERAARRAANEQIAKLRALVDEYEALLSGMPEVMVLWTQNAEGPKFLGQTSVLLPPGRRPEAILDFAAWLEEAEARSLVTALEGLKVHGRGFDISLRARDGRLMRASGWVLGGGTALRIRPAFSQPSAVPPPAPRDEATTLATARTVLAGLAKPAFLRDVAGRLVFANAAYHELAATLGRSGSASEPPELIDADTLGPHRAALATGKPQTSVVTLGRAGPFELVEFPVNGGSAGYLQPQTDQREREAGLSHLAAVINALATPIAVFNARRELVQANRAYMDLWKLDPDWLKPGLDERVILDRLRTEGLLPNEPDYHAWRARHLTSYQLTSQRKSEPWHLPDGRTIQVIAAPAGRSGGVIYVFEDITAQLDLQSQHKSLLDVQRSTLNALSEAVAVFGTNGRLTLFNPRLSALWKVPTNLLEQNPHIDSFVEAVAAALPEDGAAIWRDLKRRIIDLNPTRTDQHGRIARADGKLIDYAVTRLPDGQTMMTFLDVTESAKYQQVLKERNEALETADRLKDAFVQNVSYELRSPLTNIIGFADLLSSEAAGALNERQRAYTDYIRASSVTLGVLIDNILDLATVDAGIAELRPEPQDVPALVEKARAGLAATFLDVDGERALNLVIDIEPGLPPLVADGTRIVQVLYNLLSNAGRFSKPGGEVKLTVRARGEHMLFIVEDEGVPMPPEVRAALLGRESGATGRERGAGLGLAIVRAFVNLHGGTVTVEPREPRGSRVTVSLPRHAAMVSAAE
ncbi:MAG TPA: PAS domain-containing protein [Alphaproteobacteria bacterium]|nr:PAS domain-containing protein [Alphaproteobacteria bacterium]